MENNADLKNRGDIMRARIQALGLNQQVLAENLGVSQSQVSRILAGKNSRSSKLFEDLCIYASSKSVEQHPESKTRTNPDIQDAVSEVWDGTPGHARALAIVIRSLSVLQRPKDKVDVGDVGSKHVHP